MYTRVWRRNEWVLCLVQTDILNRSYANFLLVRLSDN